MTRSALITGITGQDGGYLAELIQTPLLRANAPHRQVSTRAGQLQDSRGDRL